MTYNTIEEAFFFVNGAPLFENCALVHRKTSETFFASDTLDMDEMPEDAEENDDYIAIPNKNDLDLGKPLVMAFVRERCSEQEERVYQIFRHAGAYRRYKDFLASLNLLDEWYDFEEQKIREALLFWCKENGIELEADEPSSSATPS